MATDVMGMPGVRERVSSHVNSAKVANNIPTKLDFLRRLKQDLPLDDPVLISEFLPGLFDLQSDRFSPARKFVTQIIGEIGLKHLDFLAEIVPVLIAVLQDDTPAVARQAIACGIDLFRSTLQMIAVQGLCSSELDSSLESSWKWTLKLKDRILSIAFQPGSGGIRLMALKFVEALILLYTPAPDGSLEPPPRQSFEGNFKEFNISWLRGGHPTLNVRDMSGEATRSLGLLLDQLRFPTVKSLSNAMIIVLIKSLSTIAKQRPAFYGRILPVLLGLDLSNPILKGINVFGASHALKSAFFSCLKCTHPVAAPWRDRIVGALKEMNAEALAKEALDNVQKANGNLEDNEMTNAKEEKPMNEACDAVSGNLRRKRSELQDGSDLAEDGDSSGKRVKAMPSTSDESTRDSNRNSAVSQHEVPASEANSSRDDDNGPVHQLVSMFGALVGQGEKAFGSLEILISSISADLLAEVVMANMQNFPPSCPKADGEDDVPLNMSMAGSNINSLPSYFADAFPHYSACREPISVPDTQNFVSNDKEPEGQEESNLSTSTDNADISYSLNREKEDEILLPGLANRYDVAPSVLDKGLSSIPSDAPDTGAVESEIPGLDTPNSALSGSHIGAALSFTDVEDASQEQVSTMARTLASDVVPLISGERSEEPSSKAAFTDVNDGVSSTETTTRLCPHLILPKMLAPVVDLDDEKKDELQKLAFVRIVEAYKQIAVAGGAPVRSSLLVFLGVEFPQELNPWQELQQHILSDYMNRDGHELTLRVLYRLFGEAEEESDFISSTTSSSAYEAFLLTVAQMLKDSFPPSDKSLTRLLGEVPYLPPSILKLMECLCCPEICDVTEKESNIGDRVTQGLSTMWNLILLRPTIRDVCLKIILQSAVHPLEKVRMKAIRLVANKLYPLSYTAKRIEDFAKEMLLSATKGGLSGTIDAEVAVTEEQKVSDLEKTSNDHSSAADSHQSKSISVLVSEAQRCMSLYFALCTKKHSLFREIFVIYKNISNSVKQAVDQHIPILVRTMGSSSELLNILSDPPGGSENLLLQVLDILISGTIPSPELIHTIKKLYDTKVKDIELLIPVLPFLPKEEALKIFPHLLSLPLDKFHASLGRMLQGSSNSTQMLTPAEILIAIHGIDPDKDRIPLKKVTDACNACFEQQQYFTQQVIAKVLNQLVEQIPLPLLFMRTVLQAIGTFPALVDFIMDILSRLVSKQIWKYPKLWVGFLKCAQLTKPQSFSVLLQLPPAQLETALAKIPALREPLIVHAKQPDVHSSLPRSTLVVLGIVSDAQASSRAQSSHTQTQGTVTDARALNEAQSSQTQNQEMATPSDAQASSRAQSFPTDYQDEGTFSDAQAPSQPQSSPTNNQDEGTPFDSSASSQAQLSSTKSQDTGNSDRETATEKSKDSSRAA